MYRAVSPEEPEYPRHWSGAKGLQGEGLENYSLCMLCMFSPRAVEGWPSPF